MCLITLYFFTFIGWMINVSHVYTNNWDKTKIVLVMWYIWKRNQIINETPSSKIFFRQNLNVCHNPNTSIVLTQTHLQYITLFFFYFILLAKWQRGNRWRRTLRHPHLYRYYNAWIYFILHPWNYIIIASFIL